MSTYVVIVEEQLNMSLEEFLRSRDVSEDTILHFKEQKIDCATLLIMPEEDLKIFIPKYGDRAAIKNFCKKQHCSKNKQSLIEKLRSKIEKKDYGKRKTAEDVQITKRNTKKHTRIIEIGWFCMFKKEHRYRQVRAKFGGGTRRISINRNSKCTEVLEKAKELFFPNGISPKGSWDQFDVELLDYKSHKCTHDLTVQELYEISALTTLRFYLATSYKEELGVPNENNDEEYIPAAETSRTCFNQSDSRSTYVLRSDTEFTQVNNNAGSLSDYLINYTVDQVFQEASVEPREMKLSFEDNTNFIIDESFGDLPQTLFLEPSSNKIQILKFHRGRVFEEFLEAFQQNVFDNANVKIEMILPNGETEFAEDFGGVFRDALSEFWLTFYEKCTVGTTLKIPYVRHDFGELQWKVIAKIFVKGFEIEQYIPIKLAPVFIQTCFGQSIEDEEEILDNFLQYISESEADVIKQAIQDFEKVDNDELLDVLTSYDAKWAPTKDNFKQLLKDIAHIELVQKPAFVIRCFSQEFNNNASKISATEVQHLYKAIKPSVKNCLAKIDLQSEQEITPERTKVYGYLKRFIKEADEKIRTGFFRFCTGSDLPIKNIVVAFTNTIGIGRVPIAHTCTGLLELSGTYENFVVFRSEWNNLLNSNIWIMDII